MNLSWYTGAGEIRLTNWPRTHLRGYGTGEVCVVTMPRPAKEVPQIYSLSISLDLLSLPSHDTDDVTKVHGTGWQFPQRKNKICGNTNNISIKILRQNPLRFSRKANRFRKEVNSGLPRGKVQAQLWATAFWMSGRDSSTSMQCRERCWLSPATSVLRTVPKERVSLTDNTVAFTYKCTIRSVPNRRIGIANSCQRRWPWYRGRRVTVAASSLALPLRIQKDTGSHLSLLAGYPDLRGVWLSSVPPGSG